MIEKESPFKQGFGRSDKDTSTLLRSACAKLRLETVRVTIEGFGEEETIQVQGQTKGTWAEDVANPIKLADLRN